MITGRTLLAGGFIATSIRDVPVRPHTVNATVGVSPLQSLRSDGLALRALIARE